MRFVRTTTTLCALGALLAPTASQAASTNPTSPTDTPARVATLGELFGPGAAADATYLLGGADSGEVLDVFAAAAGPDVGDGPGSTDPTATETPAAGSGPAGSSTSVVIPEGIDVDRAPGYASGAAGVPQSGLGSPGADAPTAWVLPDDVTPPANGPGSAGTQLGGASSAGQGTCPVQGQVSFADTWGADRSGGRSHAGTDMFAAEGTPVIAMQPGVIVKVNAVDTPGSLGGLTVSYVTSSGDRWYNAHLSAVATGLDVGDYVAAGTVIGAVGRTGNARTTPPHLHIEYHPGGGEAAPNFDILQQACRR